MVRTALFVLMQALLVDITSATPSSLDGYAFHCGLFTIGLGSSGIFCMEEGNDASSLLPCGAYAYNVEKNILQGNSRLTGHFQSAHVERVDGLVVSFRTTQDLVCSSVSLDWPNYSRSYFLGLTCPKQNVRNVEYLSFDANHFSFGLSGDVALRSPMVLLSSSSVKKQGPAKIRDLYGVFQWQHDGHIRMYFGPQEGKSTSVIIEGTLSDDGRLFLEGYTPPGPCIHDERSRIQDVNSLTITRFLQADASSASGHLDLLTTTALATLANLLLLVHVL